MNNIEEMETVDNEKQTEEAQSSTNIKTETNQHVSMECNQGELPKNVENKEIVLEAMEDVIEAMEINNDNMETVKIETLAMETVKVETAAVEQMSIVEPIEETMNLIVLPKKPTDNINSLNLLAQYGSSDESDGEQQQNLNYRVDNKSEVQCVSSDSDSDSSSSDDNVNLHTKIKKKLEEQNDSEDDDDEDGGGGFGKKKKREAIRVKGEFLLEDLPPIEDLLISVPEHESIELGVISGIVDQLVLVEAIPNSMPLDIDTVLFLDNGKKALGAVFDVLGQIHQPLYCVRFNSNEDIKAKGIELKMKVYCAPRSEHTSFVILSNVMNMKGSDASWKNDTEPPPNLVDYSDDEQERQIKKNKKVNRARPDNNDPSQQNSGRIRNNTRHRGQSNFPQSNYSWHNNINTNNMNPSANYQQNNHSWKNPNNSS
ncbi:unnamed protein product [Diamesa hyperborea]